MSVIVKGVELPECCEVCPCYDWIEDVCRITESPNDFSDTRIEDCPLAELPTPHGRLIDADNLDYELCEFGHLKIDKEQIDNAETIIEAEVSDHA